LEIFVDLFSTAVMMDTEYADKNPLLKRASPGQQKIVSEYFIDLMGDIKYKKLDPFDLEF
jgi:hypothetical protein